MNAGAIRNKLESVYRCTIGVRARPAVDGRAASLHVSFSHMPHALEGLNRGEFGFAVMQAAREEIAPLRGDEIIFSFSVSAVRNSGVPDPLRSLINSFSEPRR